MHKKYCVKNFTYNIEGTYLHDKYSFLIFNFYQCKNTTINPKKCKAQEEIDCYLNGTFARIEFTDISLDQSNYSDPDNPILGEAYSIVSKNIYKEMHIYLKSVLFKSDRGLLFNSINEKNFIQLDFLQDMFTLQPRDMFCSFTLKLSNRVDVYERKYTKFQTALANIGGILKAITTIGMVITYFYEQTGFEVDLTNKIFYISNNISNNSVTKKITKKTEDSNMFTLSHSKKVKDTIEHSNNNFQTNHKILLNNSCSDTVKKKKYQI